MRRATLLQQRRNRGKEKRRGRERKRKRAAGEKGRAARLRKGEIIKKVRKQRRRGVPAGKMAVPPARGERQELLINAKNCGRGGWGTGQGRLTREFAGGAPSRCLPREFSLPPPLPPSVIPRM